MGLKGNIIALLLLGGLSSLQADDDAMNKALAMDAGKVPPSQDKLFQQSIQATKDSIARDTLDVFYRDALDYYHEGRYDESLELLDKIYSVQPSFEDVATLRETISRLKSSHDFESKRSILEEFMRKGDRARDDGKNVTAINYWKQALTVSPSYEPAKKKIQEVNHAMANKQYEAGYILYHRGALEDALDCWANAIALDPSYKQRGLLLLMSKIELVQQKDRIMKLSAQGAQLYADKDLAGALQTYSELLAVDSRNEEARRMTAKIRIQLGSAAYQAAHDAIAEKSYAAAIGKYKEAISYDYEVQSSEKGIQEVNHMIENAHQAEIAKKVVKGPPPAAAAPTVPVVTTPANPEEAKAHYREGLAAIHSKDLHRAVQELEIARQLDPNDEHIYVALERAKQDWASETSGRTSP